MQNSDEKLGRPGVDGVAIGLPADDALKPYAWVFEAPNGIVRMWTRSDARAVDFWAEHGVEPKVLYALSKTQREHLAAAPELYEALLEVLGMADLFLPVPLNAPGFVRARAALAKARGEA